MTGYDAGADHETGLARQVRSWRYRGSRRLWSRLPAEPQPPRPLPICAGTRADFKPQVVRCAPRRHKLLVERSEPHHRLRTDPSRPECEQVGILRFELGSCTRSDLVAVENQIKVVAMTGGGAGVTADLTR